MTARVEFEVRPYKARSKVTVQLEPHEVVEYLECADDRARDEWIDQHIDRWIDAEVDPFDIHWEVDGPVLFHDLPESIDDLPPAVHPDQSTIFDVLAEDAA